MVLPCLGEPPGLQQRHHAVDAQAGVLRGAAQRLGISVQRLVEASLVLQQQAEIAPPEARAGDPGSRPAACVRSPRRCRPARREPCRADGAPRRFPGRRPAGPPARRRQVPGHRPCAGNPPTSGATAHPPASGQDRPAPGSRRRRRPACRQGPGTGGRSRRAPPPRRPAAWPPARSAPSRQAQGRAAAAHPRPADPRREARRRRRRWPGNCGLRAPQPPRPAMRVARAVGRL